MTVITLQMPADAAKRLLNNPKLVSLLRAAGFDVLDVKPHCPNNCPHNEMVETGDKDFAWKCAQCGYIYGK